MASTHFRAFIIIEKLIHAGDLLSGFIRITNWCAKHLGVELFAGDRKPDVCSLPRYRYLGKAVGFKPRAALPEQGLVDD